jgi:hypothetical protein
MLERDVRLILLFLIMGRALGIGPRRTLVNETINRFMIHGILVLTSAGDGLGFSPVWYLRMALYALIAAGFLLVMDYLW